MADVKNAPPENFKGWLYKWTNYIKGYQRRWFVLSNGLLSYYRNQAEMAHTCRGTINLSGAYIDTEDSCNFVISSGTQTFHLKASSEVERQRWVTSLELAKARAIQMMEEDSDDEEELPTDVDRTELQATLHILTSKLEDLGICNELITKHGTALQRALSDLEVIHDPTEAISKLKGINERATLFRITSNAMINACGEYLEIAQAQGRKWQKTLQYERDQRLRLEDTIETLAKQHNSLEQACRDKGRHDTKSSKGTDAEDEEEDNEFYDATEDFTSVQLAASVKGHKRTGSDISGNSIASSEGESRAGEQSGTDDDMMQDKHSAKDPDDHWRKRGGGRQRRKTIPTKPIAGLNLWSIIKNCIGKELSKIPVPVNFNEPLSMIQRLVEDLEYADILHTAAECKTTVEEMCYVAGFTIGAYASTAVRNTKPFNPLLGETYEFDRSDDLGWRALCEQVSHHPPAAAIHVDAKDWTLWTDITIASKFRGKYLQVFPQGILHIKFKKTGSYYTYRKVTSTVHNIIVGKLWVDQSGECEVVNHTTKECCRINYKPYSYFSGDIPRKVTGVVTDANNTAKFILSGTWDQKMEYAKVLHTSLDKGSRGKPLYQTAPPKMLWQKNPLPPNAENMYNMTSFCITMNEFETGVAPTDTRNRPDQRLMEEGQWDDANKEKLRLEEKQRATRRKRESEATAATESGKPCESYKPIWFDRKMDPLNKAITYVYKGKYWESKEKGDWEQCPDIF
ncbi:oxysterol-binding protein 1-like [Asterias rubens]|uniref:oxysterol-binding protein 1-like n=1 Tax=Asterias rubens TaxID=7604 RepID=UPI001455A0A4|nr:oxysterol-binding protein 1-like [Asterias rubens]